MTTDARMVEQAIRIARERVAKDGEEWWTIAPEYLARLADAAQAHLDTLPRTKMVWLVRTPSGLSEHDSLYLAAENLKVRLASGAPSGEIERREVPA